MAQRDEASVAASADAGVSGIPAELAEARATIDIHIAVYIRCLRFQTTFCKQCIIIAFFDFFHHRIINGTF